MEDLDELEITRIEQARVYESDKLRARTAILTALIHTHPNDTVADITPNVEFYLGKLNAAAAAESSTPQTGAGAKP